MWCVHRWQQLPPHVDASCRAYGADYSMGVPPAACLPHWQSHPSGMAGGRPGGARCPFLPTRFPSYFAPGPGGVSPGSFYTADQHRFMAMMYGIPGAWQAGAAGRMEEAARVNAWLQAAGHCEDSGPRPAKMMKSNQSTACDAGVAGCDSSPSAAAPTPSDGFIAAHPGSPSRPHTALLTGTRPSTHQNDVIEHAAPAPPHDCPPPAAPRPSRYFGGIADTIVKPVRPAAPLPCVLPGCHRSFPSLEALEAHTRSHTEQKQLRCTHEGCSATFSQKSNLTRHMLVHTGERPVSDGTARGDSFPGCVCVC